MTVLLLGETEWKKYAPFQTFVVPAGQRFKLRLEKPAAYRCIYNKNINRWQDIRGNPIMISFRYEMWLESTAVY
ncbi:MAG: pyrimidine/purine nucleoside phosphorylase [Bacteroidales bacterium]